MAQLDLTGEEEKKNEFEKDTKHDVINGVVFYYDDDIEMSEQLIAMLEKFAENCEDEAYNVCKDGERLVIY